MKTEYLVIGGGPTGLGAASRLAEQGQDWHLLEAEAHFGGLASSFVDEAGFTWDLGGHVQFSHYDTFDRYMDRALGPDGWLTHQRESWVWIRDRFVPYPFQNNLHRLDPADRWKAVEGLIEAGEAARSNPVSSPANFEDWIRSTFGHGIAQLFMMPYNDKVWAYPASLMDFGWIGERVPVPDLRSVLKSICTGEDEVSWGPNALFRFPVKGGTGSVWREIGRMFPEDRVSLSTRVKGIDARARRATTADGRTFKYRYLISTMPLNHLVRLCNGVVGGQVAESLVYSSTNIVGVGIEGQTPARLKTKCWIYFPESNSPYYRVTVFSNYSPNNVPRPGEQWSLMAEGAESPARPVNRNKFAEDALRALKEDRLISDEDNILTLTHARLEQGYPTPFLGRDKIVDPILRAFESLGIFSRGRFGAWKYEVSNQDHSFAQGYECVDRLISGGGWESEPTLFTPSVVNARRNP